MKTIVFVCIISLSMCLSQPTAVKSDVPTEATPAVPVAASDPKTPAPLNKDEKTTQKPTSDGTTTLHPTPNTNEANNTKTTPKEAIDNNTNKSSQETVTPGKQTEQAPPTSTEPKTSKPSTPPASEAKPTDGKANNAIVPAADKDKKKGDEEKTTVHPGVVTPTVTPNVTEKPAVLARGFDGASFVGGIILTLGLLAIGFMGFKYYKNQTERNYHTL